jgi:hypothetical protein
MCLSETAPTICRGTPEPSYNYCLCFQRGPRERARFYYWLMTGKGVTSRTPLIHSGHPKLWLLSQPRAGPILLMARFGNTRFLAMSTEPSPLAYFHQTRTVLHPFGRRRRPQAVVLAPSKSTSLPTTGSARSPKSPHQCARWMFRLSGSGRSSAHARTGGTYQSVRLMKLLRRG